MIQSSDFVPLLLFFAIFFMAFSFLETVILLAINYLSHKHWKLIVDKLLRTIVHHRTLMRIVAGGSLLIVLGLMLFFTPLYEILVGGDAILKILAITLVLEMLGIYLLSSRKIKVIIKRRMHLYSLSLFSLIAFTVTMAVASESYEAYKASVTRVIVTPILQNLEGDYEKEVEDRLIELFEGRIQKGGCEYFDYAEKTGSGFTQFIYMREDLALADPSLEVRDAMSEPLHGKVCVHETKFILTPEGKWYQVLEQDFVE